MRPSASAEFAVLSKTTGGRAIQAEVTTKRQAASESSLSPFPWMRIGPQGEAYLLTPLECTRAALMHRAGLHARDLRILDPLLSYPSTILGRERAIVVNLESVKAIITADEVLLRNPKSKDVIPFIEELRRRLSIPGLPLPPVEKSDGESESSDHEITEESENVPLKSSRRKKRSPSPMREERPEDMGGEEEEKPPFEFVALEAALDYICTLLDKTSLKSETEAKLAIDALTSKVSSFNLDSVRKHKSQLSRLSARVQKVREELEQLLDDDDDMAEMFLSRKVSIPPSPPTSPPPSSGLISSIPASPTIASRISRGGSRGTFSIYADEDNDIEELEQLLEAYFSQVDGTLNRLNTSRKYIDDTEDYINIQQDNHRNQLIQLETVLNTATMTVGVFGVVAGIFGMNIPSPLNETNGAFKWIVIFSSSLCLWIFFSIIWYGRYRRIIS